MNEAFIIVNESYVICYHGFSFNLTSGKIMKYVIGLYLKYYYYKRNLNN